MDPHLQEVLSKLEQNPQPVLEETVRILCKIGENILNNPLNTKVRTLQKTNATINNKVLSVIGGKECLTIMGFEEKDTIFVMNQNVPLKRIEDFVTTVKGWKQQLINKLKSVNVPSQSQIPSTSMRNNTSTSNTDSSKEVIKKPNLPPVELNVTAQSQIPSTSIRNNTSTSNSANSEEVIKKINLPPVELTYSNPFLRQMETLSHFVLHYEDKDLQERTRKLIPILSLEENAQNRLRLIQNHIKKNKLKDPELSIQDFLILELLQWFKEDFFSWVDSPSCEFCGQSTAFSHMSTDPKLLMYTDRVELHRCKICSKFTPFPRYNDLNILLETRRGRCGEWANTFTLCCRAMGWDARYVVDQGDHVWTEVYSTTQQRWLHCDPCENICDTPLVYESGWKKNISYVIAYSYDDIQDVTWRYSSHHKEVLKRRKMVSEDELLEAIMKIRSKLTTNLSAARKAYLVKRNLMELVEFLVEKKVKPGEFQGRTSGSEIWRLARGEIQESVQTNQHVWTINYEDIVNDIVIIRYSSALNIYQLISGETMREHSGWEQGLFQIENVFRKEEKDWKMVYLARKEGTESGSLEWKFDLSNAKKLLKSIEIKLQQKMYENGLIDVQICSKDYCIKVPKGQEVVKIEDFSGSTDLKIVVKLSGGKGDIAWQHAQICRQSLDSREFNFYVKFTFQ